VSISSFYKVEHASVFHVLRGEKAYVFQVLYVNIFVEFERLLVHVWELLT